jgi:hypothetical protein
MEVLVVLAVAAMVILVVLEGQELQDKVTLVPLVLEVCTKQAVVVAVQEL